jgi:putative endonuclease
MRRPGVRIPLPPVFARVVSRERRLAPEPWRRRTSFEVAHANAASYDSASQCMTNFAYVYILRSDFESDRFYTGLTEDLRSRIKDHNVGKVPHTAKFRPWSLKVYVAFPDGGRAAQFERYLKSASGRAFVKKHL